VYAIVYLMMQYTNQLASPKFLGISALYFGIVALGILEIIPMNIITFFQVRHNSQSNRIRSDLRFGHEISHGSRLDGYSCALDRTMQTINITFTISSRVPQILANHRNKSIGQLSFETTFMQLGGSLARVFTTFKELADPVCILSTSTCE